MIHASRIFQNQFGTASMRAVWTEPAMLQAWLDVEAAVAHVQGELKVLSKADAREIVRNCNTHVITPDAVAAIYRETGHVIVSLIKAFRAAVPRAGERFHLGMTTQDVLDTGLTLQIREALRLLVPALFGLEDALVDLAVRHRKTVMAGRSEGQQGAPITFGHKICVFASEIGAHADRLSECADRMMILTLFGAMGVQSSYCFVVGDKNIETFTRRVAEHLELAVPVVCPHQRTDRFAELGHVLALICSTLGRLGMEIRDLQLVSGLQVHADRMLAILMIGGGLTMAESVMLGLAEKSGRKVWAHQLLRRRGRARAGALGRGPEGLRDLPRRTEDAAGPGLRPGEGRDPRHARRR